MATTPLPVASSHQETIESLSIPVANPHNVRPVYSNYFGASATEKDFTIFFLEEEQIPGENGPTHQQTVKAMVTLPLLAASELQDVLGQMFPSGIISDSSTGFSRPSSSVSWYR